LGPPPIPVGIVFKGSRDRYSNGTHHSAPTFLITNRTSKALYVTPWTVQIRAEGNWTKYDHNGPAVLILPHAAADVIIDFTAQQYPPPVGTWRVEFNVAEKMAGLPALLLRAQRYPRWLVRRSNTNFIATPNPFTKGMTGTEILGRY